MSQYKIRKIILIHYLKKINNLFIFLLLKLITLIKFAF